MDPVDAQNVHWGGRLTLQRGEQAGEVGGVLPGPARDFQDETPVGRHLAQYRRDRIAVALGSRRVPLHDASCALRRAAGSRARSQTSSPSGPAR